MKKILSTVVTILVVAFAVINGENISNEKSNNIKQVTNIEKPEFKIHFIDVGQADSILIESNHSFMLVDAGNRGDGDLVTNYLEKQGVTDLEYVIGTHAHEDHIGGLDDIIRNFKIRNFFMPNVISTTKTFESVLDELLLKNMKFQTPKINDTFILGDASFKIIHVGDEDNNLNNTSIVIKVKYKDTSYLLTGDAESEVEQLMIDVDADVLKIGHHGSNSSTSDDFLKRVSPQIAVISAGADNKYGHPHQETLDKLSNINVYNTINNGTIVMISDGENISVETEK